MAQGSAALNAQCRAYREGGGKAYGTIVWEPKGVDTVKVLYSGVQKGNYAFYALMLYDEEQRRISLLCDLIGICRHRVYVDLNQPLTSEVQRRQARRQYGPELVKELIAAAPGIKTAIGELASDLVTMGGKAIDWLPTKPATYLRLRTTASSDPAYGNQNNPRTRFWPDSDEASAFGGWLGYLPENGFKTSNTADLEFVARHVAIEMAKSRKWREAPLSFAADWAEQAIQRYKALGQAVGTSDVSTAFQAAGEAMQEPSGEGANQPLGALTPSKTPTTKAAASLLASSSKRVIFPDWASGNPYQLIEFTLYGPPDHPTFLLLPPNKSSGSFSNMRLSSLGPDFGSRNDWTACCDESGVHYDCGRTVGMRRAYRAWASLPPDRFFANYEVRSTFTLKLGKTLQTITLDANPAGLATEQSAVIRAYAAAMLKSKGLPVSRAPFGEAGTAILESVGVTCDLPNRCAIELVLDISTQAKSAAHAESLKTLADDAAISQAMRQLKAPKRGRKIVLEE